MDKELRDRLYWLADELTEEERALIFEDREPEAPAPQPQSVKRTRRLTYAEKQERRQLEELYPMEERSAPVVKKKGIKGLVVLACLEILGILLVMGWWLQWLI